MLVDSEKISLSCPFKRFLTRSEKRGQWSQYRKTPVKLVGRAGIEPATNGLKGKKGDFIYPLQKTPCN
jgi:hypothetical protein